MVLLTTAILTFSTTHVLAIAIPQPQQDNGLQAQDSGATNDVFDFQTHTTQTNVPFVENNGITPVPQQDNGLQAQDSGATNTVFDSQTNRTETNVPAVEDNDIASLPPAALKAATEDGLVTDEGQGVGEGHVWGEEQGGFVPASGSNIGAAGSEKDGGPPL